MVLKYLKFIPFLFILNSCDRNPKETGIEIFPDMAHSVAYEAYSKNPVFKDGMTMQHPPQHSIARGKLPFQFENSEKGSIKAGIELKNPFLKDKISLARGKFIYTNQCLVCHGDQGKGDGPLIPKFPNPPSFTTKRVKEFPAGRLYHVITYGVGDMPGHANHISREDRWHVVNYVESMQGKTK